MIDPHAGWSVDMHERRQTPKADPVPKWIGGAILLWIAMVVISRWL